MSIVGSLLPTQTMQQELQDSASTHEARLTTACSTTRPPTEAQTRLTTLGTQATLVHQTTC